MGDTLGSVSVTLTSGGSVQATALYAPYGAVRYSNGTMPTSFGFTKQRLDGSGLNYFHARYYDSGLGQFTSADTVQGPNRYGYVGGNPESVTDPTGQCWIICAIVAGVVTAVTTTVVNAVVQQVTTGTVNWGQAISMGADAGLTTAAVMTLGPIGGALAGAVFGAVTGTGEGLALGAAAHDSGFSLVRDAVVGGFTGMIGGAIGGSFGGPISSVFAGVGSGFVSNAVGQLITDPSHFSLGAAVLAGVTGGAGAILGNSLGLGPIFGGIATTAIDFGEQNAFYQEHHRQSPASPAPAKPTSNPGSAPSSSSTPTGNTDPIGGWLSGIRAE